MKVVRFAFFLYAAILVVASVSASNLYNCQTLNAGESYILQNDLVANGTCLTINANNINIDLAGHKIIGNGEGTGIVNNGFNSASIHSGSITNFSRGTYFNQSSNNSLVNMAIYSNEHGVYIGLQANYNLVKNNNLSNNQKGISIFSSNNQIYNNNFIENGIQAIANNLSNTWDLFPLINGNYWSDYDSRTEFCGDSDRDGLCDSPRVIDSYNQDNAAYIEPNGWLCATLTAGQTITNNTKLCLGSYQVSGVKISKAGVTLDCNNAYLYSAGGSVGISILQPNVTIKNCILSDYDIGMKLNSNGIIFNNTFFNIPGWGISTKQGKNNVIRDNKFESVFISAVVENSNGNLFSNNLVDGGNAFTTYGFRFISSQNNTLAGNTIRSIDNYGVYLSQSPLNTLINNYLYDNSQGIYFDGSSTSGNTIYNNFFNNSQNIEPGQSPNFLNTYMHQGKNIMGGKFLGGNFWAQPDGKGFSETCKDGNLDGLCDKRYTINQNNFDEIPIAAKNIPKPILDQ